MLHGAFRLRPLRRNGKASHARARLCLPLTVAPAGHVPTARPASPDDTVRAHRAGVVSAKRAGKSVAPPLKYPLISGMDPAGFRARALGGGWLGHDMTGRDEWTPPRR